MRQDRTSPLPEIALLPALVARRLTVGRRVLLALAAMTLVFHLGAMLPTAAAGEEPIPPTNLGPLSPVPTPETVTWD